MIMRYNQLIELIKKYEVPAVVLQNPIFKKNDIVNQILTAQEVEFVTYEDFFCANIIGIKGIVDSYAFSKEGVSILSDALDQYTYNGTSLVENYLYDSGPKAYLERQIYDCSGIIVARRLYGLKDEPHIYGIEGYDDFSYLENRFNLQKQSLNLLNCKFEHLKNSLTDESFELSRNDDLVTGIHTTFDSDHDLQKDEVFLYSDQGPEIELLYMYPKSNLNDFGASELVQMRKRILDLAFQASMKENLDLPEDVRHAYYKRLRKLSQKKLE